eukprot:8152641-Alexandrium_andersonii.AAC.1
MGVYFARMGVEPGFRCHVPPSIAMVRGRAHMRQCTLGCAHDHVRVESSMHASGRACPRAR